MEKLLFYTRARLSGKTITSISGLWVLPCVAPYHFLLTPLLYTSTVLTSPPSLPLRSQGMCVVWTMDGHMQITLCTWIRKRVTAHIRLREEALERVQFIHVCGTYSSRTQTTDQTGPYVAKDGGTVNECQDVIERFCISRLSRAHNNSSFCCNPGMLVMILWRWLGRM